MKQEIEHEKRVMLTKNQYEHIIFDVQHIYGALTFSSIKNYYFENEESLLDKHIVLRIREINEGNCEIQIKIKGKNGDYEYHEHLDKSLLPQILSNGLELSPLMFLKLNEYGITKNSFKERACLITERLEIQNKDHLLVIDKNFYLNKEDYNLEIESSSNENAEKIINDYCLKYNLKYDENYLSKTRRVFKELKRFESLSFEKQSAKH